MLVRPPSITRSWQFTRMSLGPNRVPANLESRVKAALAAEYRRSLVVPNGDNAGIT